MPPFFDQGGTSLAALTVLSRYFQLNWSMTLAQFYEHAAIREQIAILKDAALEQTEKAREVFGQTALTREEERRLKRRTAGKDSILQMF